MHKKLGGGAISGVILASNSYQLSLGTIMTSSDVSE